MEQGGYLPPLALTGNSLPKVLRVGKWVCHFLLASIPRGSGGVKPPALLQADARAASDFMVPSISCTAVTTIERKTWMVIASAAERWKSPIM